jgi:hypothetical protein
MALVQASHQGYCSHIWGDVPVYVKMEIVQQVQESLVKLGMPTMSKDLILMKTMKYYSAQRVNGTYENAQV